MKLCVERGTSSSKSTPGILYVDGLKECFTLEDVVREVADVPVERWKVPHVTAIPVGRYRVIWTKSERFSGLAGHDVFTLELINVPGFSGIRIHAGNWATDTDGCLLVGKVRGVDAVYDSRKALEDLETKVRALLDKGEEVWITFRNPESLQGAA